MINALKTAVWAAILLVTLAAARHPPPSLAQAPREAFGIRPVAAGDPVPPALFSYVLTPGSGISDQAVVQNLADDPVNLTLYTADGFTAIDGSAAFTPAGETRRGVKDWLSTNVSQISLGPRD